ncbi:MAG: dihydroorotate dehydrogenase [Peptoniphilaceae bacterium]|nr:dihydroorotate dehydrogenase [Peptoniphilaceae bacterium]MDY6085793.1 dihydroorotate dehydrogenase [Peptoniphilaceae bacterium]
MVNLNVSLSGLALDNPVMNASGTFGYGYELAQRMDIQKMGAIVLKTATLEPRDGNPNPRIAECASGMLNSIGLQNPGVDAIIEKELPRLSRAYSKKVIASVAGNTVSEYVAVAKRFDAVDQIGLLELNISCPNVEAGGMVFGVDEEAASELVQAVKAEVQKPVYVKLTPNVTDIVKIAQTVEAAGADGLVLINTLKGMRIDVRRRQPFLGGVTGGLSGPAIFPIALRMVYEVYQATALPIIGVGGIHDVASALEMVLAGASAIQVGAADLPHPETWLRIVEDLPALLEQNKFASFEDAIGAAHDDVTRKAHQ